MIQRFNYVGENDGRIFEATTTRSRLVCSCIWF